MQRFAIVLLALSLSSVALAGMPQALPLPVPALSDWNLVGLAVILSIAAVRLSRNRR